MKIVTVGDLIKQLSKFPENLKIEVDVDSAYRSHIVNIYIDQYKRQNGILKKRRGLNVVTIEV